MQHTTCNWRLNGNDVQPYAVNLRGLGEWPPVKAELSKFDTGRAYLASAPQRAMATISLSMQHCAYAQYGYSTRYDRTVPHVSSHARATPHCTNSKPQSLCRSCAPMNERPQPGRAGPSRAKRY